jgi:hypothetical protein
MAVTVLSGTSGALYYKPAGTTGSFTETGVNASTDVITVQQYLNLKAGDPVKFRIVNNQTGEVGTGTLPAPISAATTYYVLTYTAATGALTVSTAAGGTILAITDDGTAVAPNEFEVYYAEYASVGQVQLWSLEISRADIDVTTIGQVAGQLAPSRSYIPGFADGTGTATVYVTNEDAALSNRMVEDVLQRQQVGCGFKLYTDQGTTEDFSRSITMDAVLLSASLNINPDDAQQVEITFRPGGAPTFDFSSSAGDPNWGNVQLLLRMNGTNGSTTFTDSSTTGHTITANGNAQISTAQSKFGGASCLFDGTGDYLSTATLSSLSPGTSAFTIEFWVRWVDVTGPQTPFSFAGAFDISKNNANTFQIAGLMTPGVAFNSTTAFVNNQWYHIAVCRGIGTARLYVDGVLEASASGTNLDISLTNVYVGRNLNPTYYFNGYIDDLRLTIGVDRYTANFTPPTAQFPNS